MRFLILKVDWSSSGRSRALRGHNSGRQGFQPHPGHNTITPVLGWNRSRVSPIQVGAMSCKATVCCHTHTRSQTVPALKVRQCTNSQRRFATGKANPGLPVTPIKPWPAPDHECLHLILASARGAGRVAQNMPGGWSTHSGMWSPR